MSNKLLFFAIVLVLITSFIYKIETESPVVMQLRQASEIYKSEASLKDQLDLKTLLIERQQKKSNGNF